MERILMQRDEGIGYENCYVEEALPFRVTAGANAREEAELIKKNQQLKFSFREKSFHG